MNKILLVEDDNNLGYILKEYLQMHDFKVVWVKDGEAGALAYKKDAYNICILDVMMPKKDGFTLAEEIKNYMPSMPIIFLTAKSMKIDKLKGFKLGADDYIIKPVDEEELIARVQAVLRRSLPAKPNIKEEYKIGEYLFQTRNQKLILKDEAIHLTQKESGVLELLCEKAGQLVERDSILQTIWGNTDYFKRRSMDVVISKLRKFLNKDSRVAIKNMHGKGFILEGS